MKSKATYSKEQYIYLIGQLFRIDLVILKIRIEVSVRGNQDHSIDPIYNSSLDENIFITRFIEATIPSGRE